MSENEVEFRSPGIIDAGSFVSGLPSPMDAVIDDTPLSANEARELTQQIRFTAETLWVHIARAHAGKAWIALGYPSWEAYVRGEFNMSRSRSYAIIDQANVIAAIESAVPEGTKVELTLAAAHDLKSDLAQVVEELGEATTGLEPEQASRVVNDYIEERRETGANSGTGSLSSTAAWAGEREDEGAEHYADAVLPDRLSSPLPPAPPAAPANNVDVARIRRNVNAAHDIYSCLSALSSLPDELGEVLDIIPAERHPQIRTNLERALAKLETFAELWKARAEVDEEPQD